MEEGPINHWKFKYGGFILHTVGVNWNSRSKIDTAYTGKCNVALNNKQVLRMCLKALDKVHVKTF